VVARHPSRSYSSWTSTSSIDNPHNDMEASDRTPPLVVKSVAIVGIIWVVIVLGIRLYLRYKLNGPIGNDDYAAILATTLGIAQSAVVLAGVNSGLGRDGTVNDEDNGSTTVKVSFFPIITEGDGP
jgi:hypothetical protein